MIGWVYQVNECLQYLISLQSRDHSFLSNSVHRLNVLFSFNCHFSKSQKSMTVNARNYRTYWADITVSEVNSCFKQPNIKKRNLFWFGQSSHQSHLLRWPSPPGSSSWCSPESGSWFLPCATPLPAEVMEVDPTRLSPELNVAKDWRRVKTPLSAGVSSARRVVPTQTSAGPPDAAPWLPVRGDADSWLAAGLWGAPAVPSSPALPLPAPVSSDALLLTGPACRTSHGTADPGWRWRKTTEHASTLVSQHKLILLVDK